jgi:hypothetical protein
LTVQIFCPGVVVTLGNVSWLTRAAAGFHYADTYVHGGLATAGPRKELAGKARR